MKKLIIPAIILSVAALSFFAGSWYGARGPAGLSLSAPGTSGSAPSGAPPETVRADIMAGQEGLDTECPRGP